MRKNIISIAAIATALLAASCQKENIQGGNTSEQDAPQFTASIESCGNTKTTVERVTSPSVAYKTYWESSDCINVNGATYQATPDGTDATKAKFTYQSGTLSEGTYKAYFPASIYNGTTATLPEGYNDVVEGKYNMPMYAESSTTNLSFKNLCGILAITIPSTEMSDVKGIVVTSDKQMNGEIESITEGVLTFKNVELTDEKKRVLILFSTAKAIESSATFYIPVPAGTHNPLTITVYNDGGDVRKTMVTKKSGGVTVERNVVYPITFTSVFLPGKYTVNKDGKQVQFTKGNLYWDGSAFKLEENQTDYRTTWSADHVGHFYWTKTAAASYAASYSGGSGTTSDHFFVDGSDASHKLTIDSQSGLYALSNSEWYYLINTRTNASNLRKYGRCYYNDFKYNIYLILAPDDYSGPALNSNSIRWTLEKINELGVLCLPAAGSRNGTDLSNGGSGGYYWSATPATSNTTQAFGVSSDTNNAATAIFSRSSGCSVRLVYSVSE